MTKEEMNSMLEKLEEVRLEARRLDLGWRVSTSIASAKMAIREVARLEGLAHLEKEGENVNT